jgi:hypothetical protein
VFMDSQAATTPTMSCPDTMKHVSTKYADKIDQNAVMIENILFTSPSAAAGFVNYASVNGLVSWPTADGRTLKDIESKE